MADWRQIQARIRRAKNGSNPAGDLAELYERTRDAMVAFELASWHEKAGGFAEAARWYTTAAERFRRAQWRTKAAEALARLGAPVPPPPSAPAETPATRDVATAAEDASESGQSLLFSTPPEEVSPEVEGATVEPSEEQPNLSSSVPSPEGVPAAKKRRRRGRRGGRKRHRGRTAVQAPSGGAASPASSGTAESSSAAVPESHHPSLIDREPELEPEPEPPAYGRSHEVPTTPAWQSRSRAGEPALASRIAQLESQLRRLLACPMAPLATSDQAPAGPGVLLLSDSDQVTHYYVESCQTLRIGVANLLRGGRGSKEGGQLKARMAENLGIGESRVSKYLKDHCAVRWLQLDDGAAELAHFAIAVLRPVANS